MLLAPLIIYLNSVQFSYFHICAIGVIDVNTCPKCARNSYYSTYSIATIINWRQIVFKSLLVVCIRISVGNAKRLSTYVFYFKTYNAFTPIYPFCSNLDI